MSNVKLKDVSDILQEICELMVNTHVGQDKGYTIEMYFDEYGFELEVIDQKKNKPMLLYSRGDDTEIMNIVVGGRDHYMERSFNGDKTNQIFYADRKNKKDRFFDQNEFLYQAQKFFNEYF